MTKKREGGDLEKTNLVLLHNTEETEQNYMALFLEEMMTLHCGILFFFL